MALYFILSKFTTSLFLASQPVKRETLPVPEDLHFFKVQIIFTAQLYTDNAASSIEVKDMAISSEIIANAEACPMVKALNA